ncbi:hypothetical protein GCM10010521_64440 [Streptomyces rameus]|uniref:Uncharacterized protein n=1 Tax=Streptomyces rameus TaxID=68261 RepID=A0ABN3V3G8_9ACTN
MAEVIQRDGTWAFDGSTIRITPGPHRSVPLFRRTYGSNACRISPAMYSVQLAQLPQAVQQ